MGGVGLRALVDMPPMFGSSDDTAAAISRLFPAGSACPANIRLHSHKETGAFKGSCHLNFTSTVDASSALNHLQERHWHPHGPVSKAEYADAQPERPGAHGKAPRSDTRFTMAQMALFTMSDTASQPEDGLFCCCGWLSSCC